MYSKIYNGAGQRRAHYEYDAWGNVLSVTDQNGNAITSSTHIGNLNPFRYRGYYLDTETGLYYLMSRYYDPVTHRFVNADGYFQSGGDVLDCNMSAYCRNNPIMYSDPSGFWIFSINLNLGLGLILGYSDGMSLLFDGDGNIALQKTFCYTDFTDLSYINIVGGASAGIGGSFSYIWDDVNISDLEENQSTQFGGSFGPSWYLGLDTIWLDEHTMPLSGISIGGGVGVGAEIHIQRPKSYNIVNYNINNNTITWGNNKQNTTKNSTTKQNTSTKVRCCRMCGRPDYMCSNPTYY